MTCSDAHWQGDLAQYVADGEPEDGAQRAIREHLLSCPVCREQLQWLRAVETALQEWPQVAPDPALVARIVANLPTLAAHAHEWHALPWSVWVPAATMGVALAVAMLALPPHTAQGLGLSVAEWPLALKAYSAASQITLDSDLFWTVWSGLFVAVGGVGVTVALNAWNERCTREAPHLRLAMAEAAQRLSRLAHRAF
jgi:uncharacterized protein YbaR (Trm112 family)